MFKSPKAALQRRKSQESPSFNSIPTPGISSTKKKENNPFADSYRKNKRLIYEPDEEPLDPTEQSTLALVDKEELPTPTKQSELHQITIPKVVTSSQNTVVS